MASARFTPAYAALVLAWIAQTAFALGIVVPRTPGWVELGAILGVAAVAPLAPEPVIAWLIPIPVLGLAIAVLSEPALWT